MWQATIENYNKIYQEYINELLNIKKSEKDHPLSKNIESKWNSYFHDMELYEEIQKDTMRTRSELHIFISEVLDPEAIVNVLRKEKNNLMHYDILTRILFVFAKLNPGIKYV